MLLLTVFVLAGISGVSAVSVKAATGITGEEYWPKAWAFVQDERWRTGSSYGSRGPKLSSYSSSGCCAYAADYCAYVYGDMTHGEAAILPAFIMLLKFNLAILFIQEHTGSLL